MDEEEKYGACMRFIMNVVNAVRRFLGSITDAFSYDFIPFYLFLGDLVGRVLRWIMRETDVPPPIPPRQRPPPDRDTSDYEFLGFHDRPPVGKQTNLTYGKNKRATYGFNPFPDLEAAKGNENSKEAEELLRQTTLRGAEFGQQVQQDNRESRSEQCYLPYSQFGINVEASTSRQSTSGTSQQRIVSPRPLGNLNYSPWQQCFEIASPSSQPSHHDSVGGVSWDRFRPAQQIPVESADKSLQNRDVPMRISSPPISDAGSKKQRQETYIRQDEIQKLSEEEVLKSEQSKQPISIYIKRGEMEKLSVSAGATAETRKVCFPGSAVRTVPSPDRVPPLSSDLPATSSERSPGMSESEEKTDVDSPSLSKIDVATTSTSHLSGGLVFERAASPVTTPPIFSEQEYNKAMSDVKTEKEKTSESGPRSPGKNVDASTGKSSGSKSEELSRMTIPPQFSEAISHSNKITSTSSVGTIRSGKQSKSGMNVGASTIHQSGGSILVEEVPPVTSPPVFSEADLNKVTLVSPPEKIGCKIRNEKMGVSTGPSKRSDRPMLAEQVPPITSQPRFSDTDYFNEIMSLTSPEKIESRKPSEKMGASTSPNHQSGGLTSAEQVSPVSNQPLFSPSDFNAIMSLASAGAIGRDAGMSVGSSSSHRSGGARSPNDVPPIITQPQFSGVEFKKIMSSVMAGTVGSKKPGGTEMSESLSTSHQSGGSMLAKELTPVTNPPVLSEADFNKTISVPSAGTIGRKTPSPIKLGVGASATRQSSGYVPKEVPPVTSPPLSSEMTFKKTSAVAPGKFESKIQSPIKLGVGASASRQSSGYIPKEVPVVTSPPLASEMAFKKTSAVAPGIIESKTPSPIKQVTGPSASYQSGGYIPKEVPPVTSPPSSSEMAFKKTSVASPGKSESKTPSPNKFGVGASASHLSGGYLSEEVPPVANPPIFFEADFSKAVSVPSSGTIESRRPNPIKMGIGAGLGHQSSGYVSKEVPPVTSPPVSSVMVFKKTSATSSGKCESKIPSPIKLGTGESTSHQSGGYIPKEVPPVSPPLDSRIAFKKTSAASSGEFESKTRSLIKLGVGASASHLSGGYMSEENPPVANPPIFCEADLNKAIPVPSAKTIGSKTPSPIKMGAGASASHLSGGFMSEEIPSVTNPPIFSEKALKKISTAWPGKIERKKPANPKETEMGVAGRTSHHSGGSMLVEEVPSVSSHPLFSEEDYNRERSGVRIRGERATPPQFTSAVSHINKSTTLPSGATVETEKTRKSGIDVSASTIHQSGGSMLIEEVPPMTIPLLFSESDFNKAASGRETALENISSSQQSSRRHIRESPTQGHSEEMRSRLYAGLAEGYPPTLQRNLFTTPGSVSRSHSGEIRMMPMGEAVPRPSVARRVQTRAVGDPTTHGESSQTSSSPSSPVSPFPTSSELASPRAASSDTKGSGRKSPHPPESGTLKTGVSSDDVKTSRGLWGNRKRGGSPSLPPTKVSKGSSNPEKDKKPESG